MEFDSDAHVVGSADPVLRLVGDQAVTDLLVLSHGWNNDKAEALRLYRDLTSSLRAAVDSGAGPQPAGRTIGVVAVLWPSKRFTEPGLVAAGSTALAPPIDSQIILEQIRELRTVFPDPAAQRTLDFAAALVPGLSTADARAAFAEQMRSLLASTTLDPEDGATDLFTLPGEELMHRLALPVALAPPEGASLDVDAGEDMAAFDTLFGGTWSAALHLVNFTTYYTMKHRAGRIGENGLAPVLADIKRARPDLHVHLVGHSFGSRLAAAASKALPADTITTLSLLQAAFSHHGFAEHWKPGQHGHFRAIIAEKKINGPVLATHTRNDRAVGIAYAIASRISGDAASLVGDATDTYGGMGRNGAQRTSEAVAATLLPVGARYTWQPRCPHNLLADDFIKGHADVTGREVAFAICSAMAP
ncbi:hypothetical protein SACE_5011 [Saccharopolyspora erythraea NRRL 2338]|uniref:Alpha/beta hydrolase n=1 Tax=Saccharopolyspora erythraea (strain ATCC 11635 / DSM 40517 / JCM 4748 / NBRC 13426 / NCIMB 8594 / NRRL 2338) TaxID=405948 RepID=A4FJQ0_SACEN|nr:hypothetical protein SACE_5011 [Saccharopolyspora erythraea NRRL 2338]